ncbi:MAG: DNA-binding protein [Candidatus Staskawiczbacteria bacterium RIFCSPLOWO2_01_FULL_38_12b]|uniref:DNA-binding protein n=1 Tax=Candidatus Staskawiczbacteria bacterium RIFCSPLOWO2_01_FULL_38_12b TaxID=1802214 RepID=A0A1G2IG44_9BACT|nr:MAG: DNA-binding protein [Candidatus Staskawiczbacteria bacterium RIFCSPLOWO2_01_FULL_38_12b]
MLITERLGKNIKKIRTKKGMSQGDICRALDMDRGYMSAIENGKKNITIQQLERLAQALDVSVDKLLK